MKQTVQIWYDVDIPMRDGILLRANIYGPEDNLPYPAVLLRFPYLKDSFEGRWGRLNPLPLARAGYRVVIQDCRGTGSSQGEVDFDGRCQSDDGYDTVEWVAAQPWCDGNVGMYGLSYYGFTQMLAAQVRPPHLKAICPWQQTGLLKYSGGFHTGSLHLMWLLERARDRLYSEECTLPPAERELAKKRVESYLGQFPQIVQYMPEAENPAAFIPGLPFLEDYARRVREYDDPACPAREGRPVDFAQIDIPCFFLGGWYDETSKNGPIENWIAIAAKPGGAEQLKKCRLLMGPWNHGEEMRETVGCRSFGSGASYPMGRSLTDHLIRWFNWHLKQVDDGISSEPPVTVFAMGRSQWTQEPCWPPPGITDQALYLAGIGTSAAENSGALTKQPGEPGADVYLYNPRNPAPSRLPGAPGECQEQAPFEERADVAVYTSAVLEEEVEVLGNVRAVLFVSSDCPDTDFICRLTQVEPDGRSINITDGGVRASYNNTYIRNLLRSGEIRELTVSLGHTYNVFPRGSRIRLTISSSSFPKYDRKHNTSDRIGACADTRIAENTLHHGAVHPSRLILPVRQTEAAYVEK